MFSLIYSFVCIQQMILLLLLPMQILSYEKYGKRISLSESTTTYAEWLESNRRHSTYKVEDQTARRRSLDNMSSTANTSSQLIASILTQQEEIYSKLHTEEFINDQRRLVTDILDPDFYECTVHPKINHLLPTRINVSISLYQILDLDEHSQSITVNVWMVENWFDEFLDWNPYDYGMINRTIVPFHEIWIPDTYLYNSESLEQKKTEGLMNAIVETGYWDNSSTGAKVQLMFPAIYKLSCRMDVRWFPYDEQNCSFIISSWTHDKSTIDYWPLSPSVNLNNMARNDEWHVVSFNFNRIEQFFACCEQPWVMLYAHLVIRRKPLYYIINLVIPTSIITIVAVTGFFSPTSSSSERDEKLYLGINTLLTMCIMMLMVCNQMPSTSSYVPLMSWYYIGIIFVIVVGTLAATVVLAIHGQKHHNIPISSRVRYMIYNRIVNTLILSPPTALIDLWHEFGVVTDDRESFDHIDPLLLEQLDPRSQLPPPPRAFFGSISSRMTEDEFSYSYTARLATLTRQYTSHVRTKMRKGQAEQSQSRNVKRQKMARRCALEWEFLANVLDRILLTIFSLITCSFFTLLVAFDRIFSVERK